MKQRSTCATYGPQGMRGLHPLVVEGRRVMVEQLTARFFTAIPSEGRLVQIWMSKQIEATKILAED